MTTPLTKAREALDDIRTRATAPAGPWLHKWGHVRIGNNDVWECACGQRRVTKPYDDSDAPCKLAMRLAIVEAALSGESAVRRAREDGAAHAADAMTFNGAVVEAAEGYGHVSEPCDDPGLAGGALVHRLVSAAVEQERARVVDWLRDEAGFTECPPDTTFAEHYASCIESGAHLSTLSPDGRGEVNRG